ncbi:delta-lactam-biosynthetic de-N-acetylase [Acetivibrio mesophilus]|uniref:Delta-lactam-biosynthetic de-N-acetylase n=1 Tax=Acetivibrio mesophilus TaxID=2487273 RepID=A0A4Q0I6G8_9FIRM|nr:delta-lactam-biosynthetic de-N-acetylase [Acetivibrio mesophilus]RXE59910.1 delta-lactam-biosynthetic de-N-acetylase [Acetivibrio mesophilus]HHV29685.1 delta-lactam-biosynthetic de-N-acetylase [Clostridium sp.]
MKKGVIAISIAAVLLLTISFLAGRGEEKLELPDMGGVYSVSLDNLDFSMEVTGMLSDGLIDEVPYEEYEDVFAEVLPVSGYNNKVLRWGIARRGYDKIPDADPGTPELLSKYGAAYLGDTSQKVIYLTFDEGYENGYTPKILDVLRDNNVKAVFFITGPYLNEHQDLVRRMVEEGHVVGNHTIHHPSLPSLQDKELEEEILGLDRAFHEKFGINMKFLRPPKGEYSERTLAITQKLGYTNLFWSFAYDDWHRDKIRGPQYAYNKVMDNLHNGAVLLLHAVSKDNADALDMIIKGAREKGFEFGDVNDLVPNNSN